MCFLNKCIKKMRIKTAKGSSWHDVLVVEGLDTIRNKKRPLLFVSPWESQRSGQIPRLQGPVALMRKGLHLPWATPSKPGPLPGLLGLPNALCPPTGGMSLPQRCVDHPACTEHPFHRGQGTPAWEVSWPQLMGGAHPYIWHMMQSKGTAPTVTRLAMCQPLSLSKAGKGARGGATVASPGRLGPGLPKPRCKPGGPHCKDHPVIPPCAQCQVAQEGGLPVTCALAWLTWMGPAWHQLQCPGSLHHLLLLSE